MSVVVHYRYICRNCGLWHESGVCPLPPREPMVHGSRENYDRLWELRRDGVLPDRKPGSGLRWWWISAGVALVYALVLVVAVLLHS